MKNIIATRINKEIFVEDNRCYKVFEEGYNKASILKEALNQAIVEETGLNIPHLLAVTLLENKWAIVTQYIKGKTLADLMEENNEKKDEYLNRFVDIQIDMQQRKCSSLNRHRDKMNSKISQTNLAATLRYDLHNRIERMPKNNYLCHGDFNPSNVIIDENNNAYIIDWSHATIGNYEADVARTFLLFLINDKKEIANKYLDIFCQKTNTKKHDVVVWLPILAASQSVKGIENQSEFLKKIIMIDEGDVDSLYE